MRITTDRLIHAIRTPKGLLARVTTLIARSTPLLMTDSDGLLAARAAYADEAKRWSPPATP